MDKLKTGVIMAGAALLFAVGFLGIQREGNQEVSLIKCQLAAEQIAREEAARMRRTFSKEQIEQYAREACLKLRESRP